MITEMLSDPNWLAPQIDYLVWLENIRLQFGGPGLDKFFMTLTRMGEITIPTLIICLIYWCFDSMAGLYLFSLNAVTLMFAQFFKMIACVYRPWVLSDRVHPVGVAFGSAGGYSFPSGHSAGVSSTVGGMAYVFRKHKIVCVLLILFCLMVGFSRNYLGVHTPQDVIVGLSIGLIMIFAVSALIKWCEKDKNRYLYILAVVDVLLVFMLLYIFNKSYPMDYVNGKLLVNPNKYIYTSMIYFGWVSGLLNGAFLCRRFWPFDAKQGTKIVRAVRGVIGLLIAYSLLHIVDVHFWPHANDYKLTFAVLFSTGFFITAIYPAMFIAVEKLVEKVRVKS